MSLEVLLMGVPTVVVDGHPLVVDTKKAVALLAYLADETLAASRDRLAELLWQEADPVRGRASLRRTLAALRRGLGERWVVADRDQIRFRSDSEAVVDVTLLAAGVTVDGHGHEANEVCEACIPQLRDLVGLVRGPFLDGLSVRASATFDDWMNQRALVHQQQVGSLLDRLATAEAATGDYERAISTTVRHLQLDPLHEPAHRLLMSLHAWVGDRPTAIEAYRQCVHALDSELGVKPLEETTELFEAILDNDLPRAPVRRRSVSAKPRVTRPAIVGRDHEWAVLVEAVAHDALVLVRGEPGLGKSRMLSELVDYLRRSGTPVLAARARPKDMNSAYGVVQQLLEQVAAISELGLPDWVLAQLSVLLPQLDGATVAGTVDIGGRQFTDACVRALKAARVVVVVDNAELCDPASAGVLSRLADETALGLVASEGVGGEQVANELIEVFALDHQRRAVNIDLAPLTRVEVGELIRGTAIDAELLHRVTRGVPLFVQSYLDSNLEPGSEIPEPIRSMLAARIERLSRLSRQVLSAMAVVARPLEFRFLRVVSGRAEDELLDVLDELVDHRLVIETDQGEFELVHELLRSVVLEMTTGMRRKILHGRVAAALERSGEVDTLAVAEIASHLALADQPEQAAAWFTRAADQALSVHGLVEAGSAYRSALLTGFGDAGHAHTALGDIAMLEGRFAEAILEFDTAAALVVGEELALIEHRLADVYQRLGNLDIAEHYFEAARLNHPAPAKLLADWSLLALRRGNASTARELADAALLSATEAGERSRALTVLGLGSASSSEAEGHFQAALDDADSDPFLEMAALNGLSLVRGDRGDTDGALLAARNALSIARRVGDRHRQAALHDRLADIHHRAGQATHSDAASTAAAALFASLSGLDRWQPEIWQFDRW